MSTLVLYHRHCIDGFASAFVWWKKHGDSEHVYRNYQSGETINAEGFDRFVFLDVSPKARDVRNILKTKKKIIIIDHHSMAKETLNRLYEQERGELEHVMFDENRSAAPMVAEYLGFTDENLLRFLSYIEDRDLSRFNLENTREVSIAISNHPKEFKKWDELIVNWAESYRDLLNAGQTLVNYQDSIVKIIVKKDHIVWFKHDDETEVPLINSNLYQSEIGHLLCKLLNVKLAGCFAIRGNMVNIHVRGDNADGFAWNYKGNGNYRYAGFMIPLKDFYEKLKK